MSDVGFAKETAGIGFGNGALVVLSRRGNNVWQLLDEILPGF